MMSHGGSSSRCTLQNVYPHAERRACHPVFSASVSDEEEPIC
jgi:hypothetical protein